VREREIPPQRCPEDRYTRDPATCCAHCTFVYAGHALARIRAAIFLFPFSRPFPSLFFLSFLFPLCLSLSVSLSLSLFTLLFNGCCSSTGAQHCARDFPHVPSHARRSGTRISYVTTGATRYPSLADSDDTLVERIVGNVARSLPCFTALSIPCTLSRVSTTRRDSADRNVILAFRSRCDSFH